MNDRATGMRSMENDLTLKDSPPQDKSPSGHPARRRTVIIAVAIVIAIVVISSAIIIDEHIAKTHYGPPHIGILSLSEIDRLAGQQLTIYAINGSNLKHGIILGESVFFNTSNNISNRSSGDQGLLAGSLSVDSLEFTNLTMSSLYYNISYMVEKQALSLRNPNISIKNISYDGFTFFLVILNLSGLLVYSQGYSGNYGFTIIDIGVPLSSYTALVHDEIQAMTS